VDDELPPWREKGLEKRANIKEMIASFLDGRQEPRLERRNQARKCLPALTFDFE
jgi:hypothetical protein